MNLTKYLEMMNLLMAMDKWWNIGDQPISPSTIAFNGAKEGKEDQTLHEQIKEILKRED